MYIKIYFTWCELNENSDENNVNEDDVSDEMWAKIQPTYMSRENLFKKISNNILLWLCKKEKNRYKNKLFKCRGKIIFIYPPKKKIVRNYMKTFNGNLLPDKWKDIR